MGRGWKGLGEKAGEKATGWYQPRGMQAVICSIVKCPATEMRWTCTCPVEPTRRKGEKARRREGEKARRRKGEKGEKGDKARGDKGGETRLGKEAGWRRKTPVSNAGQHIQDKAAGESARGLQSAATKHMHRPPVEQPDET